MCRSLNLVAVAALFILSSPSIEGNWLTDCVSHFMGHSTLSSGYPDHLSQAEIETQFREIFQKDIRYLLERKEISESELATSIIALARRRGTLEVYYILQKPDVTRWDPDLQMDLPVENVVFVFSENQTALFDERCSRLENLKLPQDRHEVAFDVSDGRVLLAFEFFGIGDPKPSHFFVPASQFGIPAIEQLTTTGPKFRRRFFFQFRVDILQLMLYPLHPFDLERFQKARLLKLRSQKTGDQFYLLTVETEFFGTKHLFFGKDMSLLSLEPQLRPHQVSLERGLEVLDKERLGHEFNVITSQSDPNSKKQLVIR